MKYIKLFEDFDEDGNENLIKDPIIEAVLGNLIKMTEIDEFDIAFGMACYINDYNENNPYINYLNNLLYNTMKFKASTSFSYNPDDLEEIQKMVYDKFVENNVYKKILESNKRVKILNYLKTEYQSLYKEYQHFLHTEGKNIPGSNAAHDMDEMGFGD